MPEFDKTGPIGQGVQTGRKMGKCNPETEMPGKGRFSLGRKLRLGILNKQDEAGDGAKFGWGRGLGRRNRGKR
jgi:hypothetical protein